MREKNEMETVSEKIVKGIERFNGFRAPEARAELLTMGEREILVRLSGHMCFTCGTFDYFEDLLYEIKDLGLELRLKKWQRDEENGYLVVYEIL
jgi:hypothetical protein